MQQRNFRPLVGLDLDRIDFWLGIAFPLRCRALNVVVAGKRPIAAEFERPFGSQLLAAGDRHPHFFPLGQRVISIGHHQHGRLHGQIGGRGEPQLGPFPGINVPTGPLLRFELHVGGELVMHAFHLGSGGLEDFDVEIACPRIAGFQAIGDVLHQPAPFFAADHAAIA